MATKKLSDPTTEHFKAMAKELNKTLPSVRDEAMLECIWRDKWLKRK